MGKIHDRFKQAAMTGRRAGDRVVCTRPAAPGTVRVTTNPRVELVRGQDKSTAGRLNALFHNLTQARDMDTGARHARMCQLAVEAKALGLKGRWNLLCNRTQCLQEGATWYNRGSHAFYCPACADMLNNDSFNGRDSERLFGEGMKLCFEVMTASQAEDLHVSA